SVKAGPASLYWRAATLDDFNGYGWVERVPEALAPDSRQIPPQDPLLPPPAQRGEHVLKEEVTVEALRDRHLVGASLPIGFTFDPHSLGQVRIGRDGVAVAPQYLVRGQTYTAYSYAPEPTALDLSRSPADYPSELANQGYLDVEPGITAPPFGVPGREARMHQLFGRNRLDRLLQPYVALYAKAREVAGRSTTPYQAAIVLEPWLPRTGGSAYDEHPAAPGGAPAAEASGALRRAGPLGGGSGSTSHASLLRLLALVLAGLGAAIVLAKLGLRRTRYLTRDPRRLAAACRRELADFLADQGVLVPASATAAELARAVDEHLGVDARAFVAAVDAARFGPPEEAGATARLARRELRRLERRLRDRLTRVERTRGLLSLRSLGFA